MAIQFASVRSARPPRMMAAALAESTCRSRRESDARKTMTRIAERQLRRLRRVRAGKFRSDLTAGDLAHPRNRSPHETRRIRRTRRASMRHNGLRASIPAAVATIATSPRRHGAAEGERPGAPRAGPPVPRSARLRGTRGRGMATPMAPSRTSPRTRAATRRSVAEGRGRRGRTARGSGNLEIWNPGNLRGCGARQVFRFSGFQVFTLPGPAPAGGVGRGAASCSWHRPTAARNWKPEHLEICRR